MFDLHEAGMHSAGNGISCSTYDSQVKLRTAVAVYRKRVDEVMLKQDLAGMCGSMWMGLLMQAETVPQADDVVQLHEVKSTKDATLQLLPPLAQSYPVSKPAGLFLGVGGIFAGWEPADCVQACKAPVSSYKAEPAPLLAPAQPAVLPRLAAQGSQQIDARRSATIASAEEKVWSMHTLICANASLPEQTDSRQTDQPCGPRIDIHSKHHHHFSHALSLPQNEARSCAQMERFA